MDTITRELLWSGFSAIADEMGVIEYRSSFSPVIREQLDFSCGLCDGRGRMIADSGHIPAQTGTMESALAATIAEHGPLAEGDVVIGNDPFRGATHLPDVEIFAPVYHDGVLLAYTVSVAHYIDIGGISARNGGSVPGRKGIRRDLFEEGIRLPNVKLFEGGNRVEGLWQTILANVRDPEAADGDLTAQLAACSRGAQRIQELAERYGTDAVREAMDALIEDTSQRTRAELESWPRREVAGEGFLDGDGLNYDGPIRISAKLEVRDGILEIDLTGSGPQVAGQVNIPWASTHAAAFYVARCFLGEKLRQNHGFTRHVRITAPEGTIVNPRHPAAVVSRHLGVQRLSDILFQALSDLLPDRAMASSHVSFPGMNFRAVDPRTGRETMIIDMVGGGGGARQDAPGDNAIDSFTSNCAHLPAEVIEIDYPWRVERTELVDGSGGAGREPGGLGMRRDYTVLADRAEGRFFADQMTPEYGAAGRDGGGRGAPAKILIRDSGSADWRELGHDEASILLERGDTLSLVTAGGGGYGAPAGTADAEG